MKNHPLVFALICFLGFAIPAESAEGTAPAGFTKLFNNKDLAGHDDPVMFRNISINPLN